MERALEFDTEIVNISTEADRRNVYSNNVSVLFGDGRGSGFVSMADDGGNLTTNSSGNSLNSKFLVFYYMGGFSTWFLAVSFINLIGNLIVLCLINCSSVFRRPANYLVGNLSAASLLYMATMIVRRLERFDGLWSYGPVTCRIIPVLHKIPASVVSLTLIAISSDRSRIIRNPFDIPKTSPSRRIIFIWLLSVLIVLPYGIGKRFDEDRPEHYKCVKVAFWNNPAYNVFYGLVALILTHVIPAVVLLTDVFKMLRTMRFLSLWPAQVWRNDDRRVTLMRNACIYALIFILCWLPIGIFRFPLDLPNGVISSQLRQSIRKYWQFLGYVGYLWVALHPILLFLLSHDLRHKLACCYT